jgi:membrane-bound inhibitor of C-type lysozyme
MSARATADRGAAYRGISLAAACFALLAAACSSSPEEATNSAPIDAVFDCGGSRAEAHFMYRRMALLLDGKAYALPQAESGSGARYVGSDGPRKIEFWNKGAEATLTFGEKTYPTCVQTDAAR